MHQHVLALMFLIPHMFVLQLYLFGGAGGVSSGGIRPIYNDLWTYVISPGVWTQISASSVDGFLPTARYGHSFEYVEVPYNISQFYMFGGTTLVGQTDELWTLNPITFVWTRILPAFPGAIWPLSRSFHATSDLTDEIRTWETASNGTLVMFYHYLT
jgi:hypothetical protein